MRANGACGIEFHTTEEWFKLFWIVFHASFTMVLKNEEIFS